jgi:L-fuculose-phosphate aldolase
MTKQAAAPASIALAKLRADLVCAFHVLDLDGQGSGLGGHVTARVPGTETFLCHGWGLAFDEVGADDLLHVGFGLERLEGRGKVNPTLTFHSEIYRARPDVGCVVHTHADHVVALTATGARFELVTQLAAILHDDWAFLDEYDGVVLDSSEGAMLARALGLRRALILKNHGLIAVGASIGEAVIGAVVMEACARVQLEAMRGGAVSPLPPAGAASAKQFLTTDANTLDRWNMLKRRAQRARPDRIPASLVADARPTL